MPPRDRKRDNAGKPLLPKVRRRNEKSKKRVAVPVCPQYVEVLPNVEGKPTSSLFFVVLSKSPNKSFSKDNFNFQLFARFWQEYCLIFLQELRTPFKTVGRLPLFN